MKFLHWLQWHFLKSFGLKVSAQCGHQTKIRDTVTAFGKTEFLNLLFQKGKIPHCHKCLEKMVIQCAWCGGPIWTGAPITLYSKTSRAKLTPHTVVHEKDQVAGCISCAELGGVDTCGHWMPPGQIKIFNWGSGLI